MDATARRYLTPATPPRLVTQPSLPGRVPARGPLVSLRRIGVEGARPPRLVSFAWGRVAPSRLGN